MVTRYQNLEETAGAMPAPRNFLQVFGYTLMAMVV
jgi:hypothetical protein